MNNTRKVRLFFVLAAVCVFAVFWIGFRFGKVTQEKADILYYSQKQMEDTDETDDAKTQTTAGEDASRWTASADGGSRTEDETGADTEDVTENETVESGKVYESPKYYIKQSEEYLTVYIAATDEVYFETDIPAADLPNDLKEEAAKGIAFYDLEAVYSFLESYSS